MQMIREYRSSRAMRSFNKVVILILPFLLCPYFSCLEGANSLSPYYNVIIPTFTLTTLQGIQDKLDDPFDEMGEDDVKLEYLDEWVSTCLSTNREDTSSFNSDN
jgi:hypothetical protein